MVLPHRGTAVVTYSRMKTGMVDPEAWYVQCPTTEGATWVLEKQKWLPVDAAGEWDYSVLSSCPNGMCEMP